MLLKKNFIYLVVCILSAAFLIFFLCYYSMNHNFEQTYKNNLQTQARLIDAHINEEKYRLFLEASAIAESALAKKCFEEKNDALYDEFVSYVSHKYDINILVLVDKDGVVLDNYSTLPKGYKVTVDLMKTALGGSIISDIVKFKINGISICAAAPIYSSENAIVGALMIGDSMRNNIFVDHVKNLTDVDMTVFDNDTRVATSIQKDGRRIVGTKLEKYDQIVKHIEINGAFNDDVTILDVPYKAIYWPIRNNDGERLGLWFLGCVAEDAKKSIVYSSLLCFAATLIISILICVLSVHIVNRIINPIKNTAMTDNLTNVLNRHGIENLFDVVFRYHNKTGAFILIDLDYFKDVNDTLGHPAGDFVLKRTASELKAFFRSSDMIGRMGGDEFFVFMPDLVDPAAIRNKMRELMKVLRYGFNLEGNDTLFVTASIGIAICPKDGHNYKDLYNKADTALYNIKETGRNGFGFYGEGRCA